MLEITPLVFTEWMACLLSISGSILMALRINHLSIKIAWLFWIISSFLFTSLFITTLQAGMIFGQISGLLAAFFGLYQWLKKEHTNKKLKIFLSFCSASYLCFAIYIISNAIPNFAISDLEWFGSSLSVTASLLLASRNRFVSMSWLIWLVANSVLSYTSYTNQQYGVLTLQLFFIVANFIGCYKWLKFFILERR